MEDIGCYYFMTFFPAEIQLEDNSTFKVEINDLHNSETATCFYNSLAPKEFMLFCLNMKVKDIIFLFAGM